MKIQNVAVSGPNGALGPAVINNLLKAAFGVTVLTRNPQQTKTAFPGVKVAEADYSSVSALTSTLKSAGPLDAVVCLINRGDHALQAQMNLIDATIAAKIPHFIPSSFGADMRFPPNKDLPPLQPKRQMEEYVVKKADEGAFTYTIINQGALLDWCLDRNALLNLKDGKPIQLYDSGTAKVSMTMVDDVGKAVAGALLNRDKVINKYCSIHSAACSQVQLLGYAKELAPESKFETVTVDTAELVKEAEESVRKGDMSPLAMRPFIIKVSFGDGGNLFKRTDNEVLGVPLWSEEELKGLIAKYL